MTPKDHVKAANSLQEPTTPLSSLGDHTRANPRAATPSSTGSLTNRGGGARGIVGH